MPPAAGAGFKVPKPPLPAEHAGGPAAAPSSPLFERARKRVTQRLSLAGVVKQQDSAPLRLPSASQAPVEDKPSEPMAPAEAIIPVSIAVVLDALPRECLLAEPEQLKPLPQAAGDCALPANVIMPMLPSGKVELPVSYLLQSLPEGLTQPLEAVPHLGSTSVSLPLYEIVGRIPPDLFHLRNDQRSIDQTVLSMENPFTPEMLAAGRQTEQEATAEPEAALEYATPEPEPEPAQDYPEAEAYAQQPEAPETPQWPAPEEPVPEVAPAPEDAPTVAFDTRKIALLQSGLGQIPKTDAPPEFEAPDSYEAVPDQEDEPQPELATTESPTTPQEENSFSFTNSPAYKALLASMETENTVEQQPTEPEPDPAPEQADASVPQAEEASQPENSAWQSAEPAVAEDEIPVQEHTPEDDPSVPVIPPPSISAFKTPAVIPPIPPSPTKEEEYPEPKYSQTPAAPFIEPSLPEGTSLDTIFQVPEGGKLSLNAIVAQIRYWPGVNGCILVGKDGLPIAAKLEDSSFKETFAAITPKIMSGITSIFHDIGQQEPAELVLPGNPGISIFRSKNLFLVVFHITPALPTIYRQTLNQALALLTDNT